MTEPEALEALKRAAVELDAIESDSGETDRVPLYAAYLRRAARTYARTVRPHDQD